MSSPVPNALPWASAAGLAVLIAGVVAGQIGAGAGSASQTSMVSAAAAQAAPKSAAPAAAADTAKAGATAARTGAGAKKAVAGPTDRNVTVVPSEVAAALDTAREHIGSLAKAPVKAARAFSFPAADYSLQLSSAALVPTKSMASPSGVGYSAVDLTKTAGAPAGACDIVGAGYWLSGPVERGLPNPTASKAHASAAGRTATPAIYSGPGVHWDAACASDTSGRAIANTVHLAGVEGIGSTVSASVDRHTGAYVGTARSYVLGLATASGALDSVTSLVQVRAEEGRQPVITYRVSIADGKRHLTLAGTNVSADRLPEQFAEQVHARAKAVEAFAPAVRVVLPQPTDHSLTAPLVLVGNAALGEARFLGRFR